MYVRRSRFLSMYINKNEKIEVAPQPEGRKAIPMISPLSPQGSPTPIIASGFSDLGPH